MPRSRRTLRPRRTSPADFYYAGSTLGEVVELARAGDARAQEDIALAVELSTPPLKRGRPASESELRRELMNTLDWHLNHPTEDHESLDAVITACRACLPPGDPKISDAVIVAALHRLEKLPLPKRGGKRGGSVATDAAHLARELNLLRDADGNPDIATVVQRFRKAQNLPRKSHPGERRKE